MKILVIEDDELTAHALTTILTEQNYAIEVATNGQLGWELVQAFDYDLVLLDVMLPNLDGISLCRQMRAHGLRMPILLLTGQDSSHDKAMGLDAGADDYLVKPFNQEELVARVRALLRRGSAIVQPVLAWGDLRLNPSSCEVTYDTQPLLLTPKEYALLELFLRNGRRVFSCSMILEHLWSYEEMPGEDAVRTHIKGLRHKLKAVGLPSDVVETVYGIGYRLKPRAQATESRGDRRDRDAANSPTQTAFANIQEPTQQQTLASVSQIWHRFKQRVIEQVSVLERAVTALEQTELERDLQQQARQEAHTLAGSLGTFGLSEGSHLAGQIERLFQAEHPLSQAEAVTLREWVVALRQEIERSHSDHSQALPSTRSPNEDHPLLLIVDRDRSLAYQLATEATHWGFRVEIASNLTRARDKLLLESPEVVLLDPAISPVATDTLALLTELNHQVPAIPVIVLTEHDDLTERLEVARLGRCTFLQKSNSPSQVLEVVNRVLHQANQAKVRVMVVDDDPMLLAMVRSLLEPWGLNVTLLSDPHQFWSVLEATTPDLLILDLAMPQISGIELCQVVRNDSRWSSLPILFLTAHTDADTINQVFSVGADDFVSKPIVGPELVTRLINRLERIQLLQNSAKTAPLTKFANQQKSTQDLDALQAEKRNLELRVAERTAELLRVNHHLQHELDERQKIQADLQISQAQFAGILNIAEDAIISIDTQQRITLFNQGAEKIFGYSATEVLGKPLDVLLPSRFIQSHRQHVTDFRGASVQARRMGERREIYGRRKDGSEFPAEASISKLSLGQETVFTVFLQDVTERKQIDRMKDEFISVVSHELRTPLTSIHGSLGILASGLLKPDSDQGKRMLQIAVDSTDRLVRLINDILDIERIESGRVKMEKADCQVDNVITEAVNVVQTLADKAGVTLSIARLPIQIWADFDRIVQTLTNLLSNAIKFSFRGSTVWLAVQRQADAALFTVKDQGRGIPADKLDSIFERFQQVDSSDSRNHEGTGLGLAICRSIVQQHDGQIWVESVLGEGSTFSFTVPVSMESQLQSLKDADARS